jgi:hypothetical protein
MWRGAARQNLIRELHAQNLTVREIREHLAAGKTSIGQVMEISRNKLRAVLHMLGLKTRRFSARYVALGQKAAELSRDGRSLDWIAQHFNEQGFPSTRGNPWSRSMVHDLIVRSGEKTENLGNIHRKAIADARARGLSYREMAIEFNERKIRRKGGPALDRAERCEYVEQA